MFFIVSLSIWFFSVRVVDAREKSSFGAIKHYFDHAKKFEKSQIRDVEDGRKDDKPFFFVGAGGLRHPESDLTSNLKHDSFVTLNGEECDSSAFKLTASPDVLPQQLTNLTVSWSGVHSDSDWVGLYSPSSSDNDGYVDWISVQEAVNLNKNGEAESQVTFRPLNLRDEAIELRYFTEVAEGSDEAGSDPAPKKYKCLARSNKVQFQHGEWEPMHGRLEFVQGTVAGLLHPVTGIRVTWTSGVPVEKATPFVEFRAKGAAVWEVVDAQTRTSPAPTYAASDLCESPANITSPARYRHPGYFHTVILSLGEHIAPDQEVEYRFGQSDVLSSVRNFRAPPAASANPDSEEWSFVAYADHGTSGSAPSLSGEIGDRTPGAALFNRNLRRMLGVTEDLEPQTEDTNLLDPSFALHFGDLAYAWSIGFTWDLWHREIEPVSSKIPYMVTLGNHEYDYRYQVEKDPTFWNLNVTPKPFHPWYGDYGQDSSGECAVPVYHRWFGVGNNDDGAQLQNNGPFWYSFSYKNVFIIQMSSEHDFEPASVQYQWLVANLKSVDRNVYPWVVVTSHRPSYKSELWAPDRRVADALAAALDPIFLEYKVDLFLTGHYHDYERTCAVTGWKCVNEDPIGPTGQDPVSRRVYGDVLGNTAQTKNAPVHICVGSAGAWTDHLGYSGEYWSLVRLETVGFLNVRVNGRTSLDLEFWGKSVPKSDDVASGDDFEVLDRVSIFPYQVSEKEKHHVIVM